MKNLFVIVASTAMLSFTYAVKAQEKQDTASAGYHFKKGAEIVVDKTEEGAEKVGNKTAEIASKGAAKMIDKTYVDKVGPSGQTIYIDKHSKYYYVDEKGKKVYVTKREMKAKKVAY